MPRRLGIELVGARPERRLEEVAVDGRQHAVQRIQRRLRAAVRAQGAEDARGRLGPRARIEEERERFARAASPPRRSWAARARDAAERRRRLEARERPRSSAGPQRSERCGAARAAPAGADSGRPSRVRRASGAAEGRGRRRPRRSALSGFVVRRKHAAREAWRRRRARGARLRRGAPARRRRPRARGAGRDRRPGRRPARAARASRCRRRSTRRHPAAPAARARVASGSAPGSSCELALGDAARQRADRPGARAGQADRGDVRLRQQLRRSGTRASAQRRSPQGRTRPGSFVPNCATSFPARRVAAATLTCWPRIARTASSKPSSAPGTRMPGAARSAPAERRDRRGARRDRVGRRAEIEERAQPRARSIRRSAPATRMRDAQLVRGRRGADLEPADRLALAEAAPVDAVASRTRRRESRAPRGSRAARPRRRAAGRPGAARGWRPRRAATAAGGAAQRARRTSEGARIASLKRRTLAKPAAKATSVIGSEVWSISCLAK